MTDFFEHKRKIKTYFLRFSHLLHTVPKFNNQNLLFLRLTVIPSSLAWPGSQCADPVEHVVAWGQHFNKTKSRTCFVKGPYVTDCPPPPRFSDPPPALNVLPWLELNRQCVLLTQVLLSIYTEKVVVILGFLIFAS